MMSPVYTEMYDGTRRDYGAKYGQTLTIHFDLIKDDYSTFSLYENRQILQWLIGNKKNAWLTLTDYDQSNICELYGRFINIQEKASDANILGYMCEFECTTPYAYSTIRNIEQVVDSEQTFILENNTDCLDAYVYPTITIEPQENDIAELHIFNKDTAEDSILIDIKSDEFITIDSYNKIVTSNDQYKHVSSNFYGKRRPNDSELYKINNKLKETKYYLEVAQNELLTIQQEAQELGVDLSKVQYGNIDLNNRGILEWNKDNLSKYDKALDSYNIMSYEVSGTYSTVLGMCDDFGDNKNVKIAFSPLLQTNNEPELLKESLVREYMDGLIKKTTNPTYANLVELDKQGLTINDKQIKCLIADVGKNAPNTAKIIRFGGINGDIAKAENKVNTRQDIYNSLKATLDPILSNPDTLSYTVSTPIWPKFVPNMNHITVTTTSKVKIKFSYRCPMAIGTVINGVI